MRTTFIWGTVIFSHTHTHVNVYRFVCMVFGFEKVFNITRINQTVYKLHFLNPMRSNNKR